MRMHILRGLAFLAILGLAGCGSSVDVAQDTPPPDAPPPPPPPPTRLADATDVHLDQWLQQPRPELAQLVAEWSDTVRNQRQHAAENPLSLDLLPGLQPPGTMPVFAQAAYSQKAGFSLPPYLKAGDTDAAVALHLARFGDRDAALQIADPSDKDLHYRMDGRRTDRNYPLEWTQLTALAFQSAEWKLATGEPQAAADLLQMHKQLRGLLDDKAAAGPLGAALLPLGRRALVEAAAAWKRKANNPELAQDIEDALKGWGETPPPALALAPGASQFEAARLFGRPAAAQAVAADKPETVARALDLLELPAPADGAQAVVAFFDADKRLTETLVLYKPRTNQTFPDPVNLGHYLVNRALASDDPVKGVGLTRRTWTGDGLRYEAAVISRGDAVGGLVRITGAKPAAALPAEARDFGAVHLDRTFEQNRVQFARGAAGPVVTVDCGKSPGAVRLPVFEPAPAAAVLEREKDLDLTASLAVEWPADEAPTALTKIVVPLLGAYGSPRIDGAEAADGDCLALVWEDARTRLTMRLPYEGNPLVFRAENRPGSETADARVLAAEAFDLDQRKARLDAGRPLTWLPRTLAIPEIRLGLTKKQVLDALPRQASIDQQNLGGDLSLVFHDAPAADATYGPRQMFLRFHGDRLAEVRVRYQEGPAKPDDRHPSLLNSLKQSGGEPRQLAAPWAALWPDLPAQEPKPTFYRWADDVTVLTCQRDGGGAEAILRDWPAGATPEQAENALPPLRFCEDGAAGVRLGMTRAEVFKKFPDHKALDNEDGVALPPPADSPYETLAVWFDGGKVVRVVAQHEARPTNAADVKAKMEEAWVRDFDHLGAPRRQEGARAPVLQAYGWNDDRVRVRMAAQQTADGPRLFTEWRNWPVTKP